MGATIGLLLLSVLCTTIGGVQAACKHVQNDDMVEYSCVGGQISDLDSLPEETGKIRIANMPITRITADTFSRFGSELWVLGCSQCGIEDIEPGALQRLVNLQQLSLDNNRLTTIKGSWFKGLDYLTFLDLNYNNIESIEDGVFTNLPSLIDLRLSGNHLECLNLEAMSRLKDLKRIFLAENAEFKCPNAVSTFLENRGVIFERDPEWSKIPNDLVPAEGGQFDYYSEYDETTVPTTTLPTHRERLHLAPPTPQPPPVETTAAYEPPRVHTTEEVVYHPVYATPDWRSTSRQTTAPDEGQEAAESSYDDDDDDDYDDRRKYAPPRTIAPLDAYDTTPFSTDETTLRPWAKFPESAGARPKFPLNPPHENENGHHEQPHYPSETANPLSLAPVPDDRYGTPTFVESHLERTIDPHRTDWPETNTVTLDSRHPSVDDNGPPEYRIPMNILTVDSIQSNRPEMIQPASPGNVYQAPYYEHPITAHAPPIETYPPNQEGGVTGTAPIETTTDKPMPECPNSSPAMNTSVGVIALSILLAMMNVLVEGF